MYQDWQGQTLLFHASGKLSLQDSEGKCTSCHFQASHIDELGTHLPQGPVIPVIN